MTTFVRELLERMPSRPTRTVPVVCATPTTFYIDGDTTTALPCRVQTGSFFTSGQSGMAYWTPPSLPICFKTN